MSAATVATAVQERLPFYSWNHQHIWFAMGWGMRRCTDPYCNALSINGLVYEDNGTVH